MGARFSIKVVAVATEVREIAREKGRRKGGQERGPKKHKHLREQTKGENQKNRKRHVREMLGQPREKGVLEAEGRDFQEKSARLNQMLRRFNPVRWGPGRPLHSAIGNLFTERWQTEGHCCVFYAVGEIWMCLQPVQKQIRNTGELVNDGEMYLRR